MSKRTREERREREGAGGWGWGWNGGAVTSGRDRIGATQLRGVSSDPRGVVLEQKGQEPQGAGGRRKGAGPSGKRRGLSRMGGALSPPAPPPTPSPLTAPRQPAHAASFPPSGAAGPAGPGRTPGTRTRPPGPAGGGIGGGTGGRGSHHGVPSGGVSEASGSRPREAAPVSVVRVLGGEQAGEGPRRTHIPTWAETDGWRGDTRGWASTHLSVLFSPSSDGPLSLMQPRPSSHSFFRVPPHP